MNKTKMLLLLLLAGLVIVVLPDSDLRLFSFSKDHGPSLQDVIGLVLVLSAYICLLRELWRKKEKLRPYSQSGIFKTGIFLFGLGHGLVIASVAGDHPFWWVYGVILLAIMHVVIFYLAFK